MAKREDLTGRKFGDLTVVEYIGSINGNTTYKCLCVCGNYIEKTRDSLLKNKECNLHCGCKPINYVDKTGNRYGRLIVLGLSKTKCKTDKGKPIFTCQCDCGNIVDVSTDRLRKDGHGKRSCGCLNIESARQMGRNKRIDITGQKFGRLTALQIVEKDNRMIGWECQCDCGNKTIVPLNALKSGNTQSCGCFRSKLTSQRLLNDLTGRRFGRLTVISRAPNNGTSTRWNCLCDCGNTTISQSSSLLSGHSQSCGCLHSEITSKNSLIDITGEKFGTLTVIRKLYTNNDRKVVWECKCDCGNIKNATGRDLRNGTITSCGCNVKASSKGEAKIFQYLNNLGIANIRQYSFLDLKSSQDYLLKFDFYLPNYNLCIEYDGEGHYRAVNWNGCTDNQATEKYNLIKENDNLKNEYCFIHNIILLRIPFWEFNNIEKLIDQTIAKIPCQEQGAAQGAVT